jgi:hypothetical protein
MPLHCEYNPFGKNIPSPTRKDSTTMSLTDNKASKPLHTAPRIAAALGALIVGSITLIGCDSPTPQGDSGGRIDPYNSTSADERSDQANMPELLTFAESTASQLAQDLSDLPINHPPSNGDTRYGAILELGQIVNKTRTSSVDFELIQKRVRNQLLRSKIFTDQFVIVESGTMMDLERETILGDPQNENEYLLQGGSQTAKNRSDRYDPNYTYVLRGEFFEARRGSTRRYYLTFNLVQLQTRQIVFTHDYLLGQSK